MRTLEIREEIVELISAGKMKLALIVSYFKANRPDADINVVKAEAKELIAEARQTIKRGY